MTPNQQIRALLQKHCSTIRELVETMVSLSAQVSDSSADSGELVARLEGLAHQLKGSSGSIGFSGISAKATQLDDCLKRIVHNDRGLDAADWQASVSLLDELRRLAGDVVPEKSALYNFDLSRLSPVEPPTRQAD